MRLPITILLPFAAFFTIGHPIAGVLCLLLQLTIIGWIPAAIWSAFSVNQYTTEKKIAAAMGQAQRN